MSLLIGVDAALDLLAHFPLPHRTARVHLSEALGKTLAQNIVSRVTRPPMNVSAMDGYAVRLKDVRKPGARLEVVGEAPAGRPFDGSVGPGQAVRIFTGSIIPAGADHVVIQENVSRDGGCIICLQGYDATEFIRAAGIDFSEGDLLVTAGTRLGPSEVSIAAAGDHADAEIVRPLRVGILANGDELRAPGTAGIPGQIVNSNPQGLGALIREWGAEPVDLGVASDSIESIRTHIDAASDIDVFLPVGGASVGDHDLMRPAFAQAGFEPVFAGVAVKPGKPTWFSVRRGQCALGLPGNPASAFVCAHIFLRALLMRQARLQFARAVLLSGLPPNGDRETFFRAAAHIDDEGRLVAMPASNQDSSLIHPFLTANVLIRQKAGDEALDAGDVAEVLVINRLG